jgi:hypothetical protein
MIGVYFKTARASFCTLYACPFIPHTQLNFPPAPSSSSSMCLLSLFCNKDEHHLLSFNCMPLYLPFNLGSTHSEWHKSFTLCFHHTQTQASCLFHLFDGDEVERRSKQFTILLLFLFSMIFADIEVIWQRWISCFPFSPIFPIISGERLEMRTVTDHWVVKGISSHTEYLVLML